MPEPWSLVEVEAAVSDYVAMLEAELEHQPYSKTEHRRNLAKVLAGRPDGAIERKHQNISAILIELGYPYISGYKPLGNYQGLLRDVVADRVASDQQFAAIVARAVAAPANVPSVRDILDRLVSGPEPSGLTYLKVLNSPRLPRPRVNYLEREARNRSLGLAGEQFCLNFERARLLRLGRDSLAERIEHVSVTGGDGAGFDIRSFEEDGTDRFVEVKTTAYGKPTPFFVSRNEVAVSRDLERRYHVYRLFTFRDDPRFFTVPGALERTCHLEAVSFSAKVRA